MNTNSTARDDQDSIHCKDRETLTEQRRHDTGHCGRRDHCPMMEEDTIEEIAEKAAEKAIEKLTSHVYQEIGRGLVSKFLWLVGAASVGLYVWLNTKGLLK